MLKVAIFLFAALSLSQAQINWQPGNWAMGCDFLGNDIANVLSKGEDCSSRCQSYNGCTHFTWSPFNGGTCWMKTGSVRLSDAVPKSNDYVCGIIGNPSTQCEAPLPLKKLIWSDEFNNGLGEWNQEIGGHGWGNGELQYYTNRNARTEGGLLKIQAKREQIENNQYSSSRLISKRAFRYGVFEARVKLARGNGLWPAFWLLAANRPLNWPLDGEIDVLEHWGCRSGFVEANIHTGRYNHMIGTNKGNKRFIDNIFNDFHTYRLDWNAQRLIFYVDNCKLFQYDKTDPAYDAWPYNNEFNLIINLAIDRNIGGCPVDDSVFPAELVVDYVRQYEAN